MNSAINITKVESAISEYESRLEKQNNLLEYYKYVFPSFISGKHIDKITNALERVEKGELKRLIISLPPRHSKSQTASIVFPTWFLGRNPNKKVVLASYSQTISDEQCRRAKELFLHERYNKVFGLKIGEKNTENYWETGKGGSYYSVGVTGSLTGKGFDLGIIDDYAKDRSEAGSEVSLKRTLDWYRSTFYTRQSKNAAIVIIATRWAQDDLIGTLIREEENGGEKWEKLILPAINDSGDVLWPELFDLEKINQIRQAIGSFEFSALYQQEPSIRGGNRLKADNIVIHNDLSEFPKTLYIRCWDLASSTKQRDSDDPDYTVGVLATVTKKNSLNTLWIKDVVVCREEAVKRNQLIINTANKDGCVVPVYVESFGAYKDAYAELRQLLWGRCNVNSSRPPGDKSVKASPLEAIFEAGNAHLLKNNSTDLFLKQLREFPYGKHDDCVDSLSLAYYELSKPKSGILIT